MSTQRAQTDPLETTGDWEGRLAAKQTSCRGCDFPSSLSALTDLSPESAEWREMTGEEGFLGAELQTEEVADLQTGGNAGKSVLPGKERKKRGRKLNRPFDPVHKKTEEKDKYWLRAFRAYMQTHFPRVRKSMSAEVRFFWRDYLGPEGKPEKGNRYSSFGRQYKNALFANSSFVRHFHEWFETYGEAELLKKYPMHSPLWFVFYDYAAKDLLQYDPNSPKSIQPDPRPVSPAEQAPESEQEGLFLQAEDEEGTEMELLLEEI